MSHDVLSPAMRVGDKQWDEHVRAMLGLPAVEPPVRTRTERTVSKWSKAGKACSKFFKVVSRNSRKLALILTAFVVGLATMGIIGVAGYISFVHIHDVAIYARQSVGVAVATPFTIDGMILVGGYRLRQPGINRTRRIIALAGVIVGILASAGGNLLSALIKMPDGIHTFQDKLDVGFSIWPVIPLIIALEMMIHVRKAPALVRTVVRKTTAAKKTSK